MSFNQKDKEVEVIHVVYESKRVGGTLVVADPKKAPKVPQVVRDHQSAILRDANNEHLSVQVRVDRLNARTAKYRGNKFTGLDKYAGQLQSNCEAVVSQLISVEKAKSGSKDHGAIDGADQRKVSTMTTADQTGAVKA